MELQRHHYLILGIVLLALGFQFRRVESFQLTEQTTRFLAERAGKKVPPAMDANSPLTALFGPSSQVMAPKKTIRPPRWLGWSLLSVGGVLVFQALMMRKL